MIEKILHRPAHATVVIGRPEQKDIRALRALLQGGIARGLVGGFWIEEGQRGCREIQQVHLAAGLAQFICDRVNGQTHRRGSAEAAHDGEHPQRRVEAVRIVHDVDDAATVGMCQRIAGSVPPRPDWSGRFFNCKCAGRSWGRARPSTGRWRWGLSTGSFRARLDPWPRVCSTVA